MWALDAGAPLQHETEGTAGRSPFVIHAFRFRATIYEGHLRQPPHEHDHLQISLVLRGRLRESVYGVDVTASALSTVVRDAGVVHQDHFGPEQVGIAQLAFPGGLGDLIDAPDRAPAWSWTHSALVARPFLRIVTRAAAGARTFASDDTDIVDLLALVTARRATSARGNPPRWLADAVDELRSSWRAGMRVSDVAARVGVHPVYLARCFRRWYGHGVSDALRQLRQRAAAESIIADVATLSAVAHAAGYADEAHLNREFRQLSGVAPGRFRRAIRQLDAQPGSATPVAGIQV